MSSDLPPKAPLAPLVEVAAMATFGNIEIIVPPHLAVETEGNGILGSVAQLTRAPREPDPGAPLLRVRGTAVFGNIEVVTRLRSRR
jgi:hypothetical protein